MGMEARKQKAVVAAIDLAMDEVNAALPAGRRLIKSSETILFGQGGALDSLGFINLIVAAERHLEAALHAPITLADERAMSQKNSPFRTVGALVSYVCGIAADPSRV